MKENKKVYSFRLDKHRSNTLSMLASKYHMDRTSMFEYMIDVWGSMWVEKTEDAEKEVLDSNGDT